VLSSTVTPIAAAMFVMAGARPILRPIRLFAWPISRMAFDHLAVGLLLPEAAIRHCGVVRPDPLEDVSDLALVRVALQYMATHCGSVPSSCICLLSWELDVDTKGVPIYTDFAAHGLPTKHARTGGLIVRSC